MKKPVRTCPVPLCGTPLKQGFLMCAPCWRRVTRAERKEFRETFSRAACDKVIRLSAERR